ncbi:MAG: 16S rRNA (guanine(966)-N(2))-methyltransferase RsmD [Bryobacteraceae bacterium]|jgi:16S rRNA (guanine(966)-N(2))-methyltransferase RsmD
MRLRVIAGEFRSRLLKSVPGLDTRPTPDRLREALFNVLAPVIEGAVFLDAYAGTGAVGIEALSRGARRAIFVERNRGAVEVIRDNLAALGIAGRAEVYTGKALPVLERVTADIIFLDPPYALANEYKESLDLLGSRSANSVTANDIPHRKAAENGPSVVAESRCPSPNWPLVIVQHAHRQPLDNTYGLLHRTRILRQGDNALSFFTRSSS